MRIQTKKVGAGQFQITVIDGDNVKSYIENDMTLYDALTEADGMYDISQDEAIQLVIYKSGL
jgi:hypothetical protein